MLVVIPAYNEWEKIARVIAAIRNVLSHCDILVVNDGSHDNTAEIAERAGAVVLSHPFNMGYGVTVQTGYKYAHEHQYEYVVQIDGDGQHDAGFIPRLLDPVMSGDTDVAVGSRFKEIDSYRPSFSRRLGILLFRKLVSILIGREITDPTSGYQAFNSKVVSFFTTDIFPCDYPDADILITLNLAGFRIREVPVRMYASTDGKTMHSGFKPLYYVFKMFLSILVTLLRSRKMYWR